VVQTPQRIPPAILGGRLGAGTAHPLGILAVIRGRVLRVCSVKHLHLFVTRRSFFPYSYTSFLSRENPTLLGGVRRSSQGQPLKGIKYHWPCFATRPLAPDSGAGLIAAFSWLNANWGQGVHPVWPLSRPLGVGWVRGLEVKPPLFSLEDQFASGLVSCPEMIPCQSRHS